MSKETDRNGTKSMWALVTALGLLVCIACNNDPTHVAYLDLLTTRSLRAGGELLRTSEVFAVDETWVAVTLESGEAITTDLELESRPVMTLAGCLVCSDGMENPQTATLGGTVDARNGRQIRFSIELDSGGGWWTHDVDLTRVANRKASLRFDPVIPEGCVVRLREATVRHWVKAPKPAESNPTQILLISVDTLRNDAVGAFGGNVDTPHLDRFAAQSEIWQRHYATASWTKPSHASMLTGFYPQTHRAVNLDHAMDPSVPTLAGRFRAAGFKTSALVFDCTWLSPRWGFAKGFDSYQITRWRAQRQMRSAVDWALDHRDRDFFYFLHTFEPHSDFNRLPYEAPGLTRKTLAERFGVTGFGCRLGVCASGFVNELHRGGLPLESNDAEILRYCYDEGVRYVDRAIGELFESLRTSGLWEQMLIVVTSDHGEAFGERGEFGHNSLHEEIVRVPLIIKWPNGDRAGENHGSPCSAVDLAPTLLNFAGLAAEELPGQDLRARLLEKAVFSGTLDRAVILGDEKGIFSAKFPAQAFNLAVDPGERTNLAAGDQNRTTVLREMLDEHRRQSRSLHRRFGSQRDNNEVVLSERERERLRAFGYLDSE